MKTVMRMLMVIGGSGVANVFSASETITPSVGANVITTGDFSATGAWVTGTGWSIAAGVASHVAGTAANLAEVVLTTGVWYQITWTLLSWSAGTFTILIGSGQSAKSRGTNGTYLESGRATTDNQIRVNASSSGAGSVDNISALPITLSSMFGVAYAFAGNYLVQTDLTLFDGTPEGVYLQLDSTSSPANFVVAYHDGTRVKMDKCVGGTYTNLVSSTVTYVPGATLKVVKNGTTYQVFYAGSQVGADQTVSDAGIIAGTFVGRFRTHASNSSANLIIAGL